MKRGWAWLNRIREKKRTAGHAHKQSHEAIWKTGGPGSAILTPTNADQTFTTISSPFHLDFFLPLSVQVNVICQYQSFWILVHLSRPKTQHILQHFPHSDLCPELYLWELVIWRCNLLIQSFIHYPVNQHWTFYRSCHRFHMNLLRGLPPTTNIAAHLHSFIQSQYAVL